MALGLTAPYAAPAAGLGAERRQASDIRIVELDGLRGLMMLFVLFSHFFVEVPNGVGVFYVGWVAVIVFFVLSGYLVGRLIIEKKDAGSFLPVFYLRRVCREQLASFKVPRRFVKVDSIPRTALGKVQKHLLK